MRLTGYQKGDWPTIRTGVGLTVIDVFCSNCRQCQGRVNSDEPPLEDDDVSRNAFCDVRFDR